MTKSDFLVQKHLIITNKEHGYIDVDKLYELYNKYYRIQLTPQQKVSLNTSIVDFLETDPNTTAREVAIQHLIKDDFLTQ